MKVLEKKEISFLVKNDLEILSKLNEAKKEYESNNLSYSTIECYNEHTNLINNY